LLYYPHPVLRASLETLAANERNQPALWSYAVSGDYPILLMRINAPADLALVQQALQAHTYWRNRGLKIDLVILNQQGTTYGQELRGQLQRVLVRQSSENWLNRRGGIFTLYADQLSEADRVLLETAARAVLDGSQGSLAQQLEALRQQAQPTCPPSWLCLAQRSGNPRRRCRVPAIWSSITGGAGSARTGASMSSTSSRGQWTPAPWINVIANPDFGFTVSETGAGYTWSGNSSENRLTPWANDPVVDPPGEALYLRDEETAAGLVAHAAAAPRARAGWIRAQRCKRRTGRQEVFFLIGDLLAQPLAALPDASFLPLNLGPAGCRPSTNPAARYGFRDQLQDVMAFIHAAPGARPRAHPARRAAPVRGRRRAALVASAFGRGVRTRFSDDLLWLPYVTAIMCGHRRRRSILDEKRPFLSGAPLEPGEAERYDHYETTSETHALRALPARPRAGPTAGAPRPAPDRRRRLERRHEPGRIEGRGESVWLGWFLHGR
jgi:cellobiose phosphorylase